MHDMLGMTLVLLAGCSLAAALAVRLRIPTLLGYLLVGVLLGPSVMSWVTPGVALGFLSELGVALLLFMVGLEFSLGHFWLTRKTVLLAGTLQMTLVAVPVTLVLLWLGLSFNGAALLGVAAAMSSTALVSRQLADQGELTTRHGRTAIAVLVFQDLASVPVLALLAIWARGESPGPGSVLLEVLGVLALFALSAIASRRLLHGVLGWVARQGHEESFVLVSLSLVVAAAAGAHALGVSAALGAFLAGMVLGECDFRHHMEGHLKPFRDVLSGVFFVTIGLQLDVGQIVAAPLTVLGWLLVLIPLKTGLNFIALRATRLSSLDAWRTGIVLGHGGEFALLLLGMVMQQQLMAITVVQPMLVALVLSMGLAPLLIRHHGSLAQLFGRSTALGQPPQAEEGEVAEQARLLNNHVIICGADDEGLLISETLRLAGVPHLLLEADRQRALAAQARGAPVTHGDASRPATLKAAGLERASMVVLRFAHLHPAERVVRVVRECRADLPVIVSCHQVDEFKVLRTLPNVYVYHEALTSALGLAEQVMQLGNVSQAVANRALGDMRDQLNRGDRSEAS